MDYLSFVFYAFVAASVIVYYIVPVRFRWGVLLMGSVYFYCRLVNDIRTLAIFLISVFSSFAFGILIEKQRNEESEKTKGTLFFAVFISLFVLIGLRFTDFFPAARAWRDGFNWLVPVGVSFYSLQLAAYLTDVYRGKISAQRNPLKFLLFSSFFPQIIQGPVPRYEQLGEQLFKGNRYDSRNIIKGIQLILWGFFLKLMIADRAAVVVNTVFNNYGRYEGFYILVASVLYSIQLYADFLSCVTLSQGTAQLYGISLADNFNHPFFSTSIQEFWRRWHMSFSFWLRDYIYIPLGGNRKGKFRKYVNLIITFAVSGIWHGGSLRYVFWGLTQAMYQIVGGFTYGIRDRLYERAGMGADSWIKKGIKTVSTFLLITLSLIIFRAESLKAGIRMIWFMFRKFNPWIFFNDALFKLGLDWKEWAVLLASVMVLAAVSFLQCRFELREKILEQNIVVRWTIYLLAVWIIWIFGTYGYGFDARDFIYGGF